MATNNIPVPGAMACTGDLAANWRFFRSQWEDYEVATELDKKDSKVRAATLRSVMGRDCLRVYQHLTLSDTDKQNVQKTLDALQSYFMPARNTIYERYIFNTTDQGQSENIDQYVTRLRQLAATCEFGGLHDELIRDRIVLGARDISTRRRMLRVSELTLQKAIDMCRSHELTEHQLQTMQDNKVEKETVHYTTKTQYRKEQTPRMKAQSNAGVSRNCKYCGSSHTRGRDYCAAYGKTCSKCKRLHHFASVCRQKREVIQMTSERENSSSEESVFTVIHQIGSVSSTGSQWFVPLELSIGRQTGKRILCQLDCGATCNLMAYKDYCKLTKEIHPTLQKSNVKLKWYNETYMTPVGQCTLHCTYKEKRYRLLFQVVKANHKPLLSADTCQKMGLLTLNIEQNVLSTEQNDIKTVQDSPLTYEKITDDYKDLFQGLGCLPGEYHLEVDTSITPVQHQPRRVPAPLKAELKQEIQRLEKLGVLKKVTVPTPWISSMVAVKRPGKLRVCIDPKDLNKAIKRSHYPMPTIEQVLPSLAKAKVFSVLDAKDGFWQVKLDTKSSYLTTFWTPFGRYRWLRMPFGLASAPEEYQRRQHEAVEGLPGVEVIADDILVYGCGDTTEDATANHDKNLIRLLERARKLNLKLNKQKLRLRLSSVSYMGHILSAEGLHPDPEKIRAILEMPKPENVQAVQRLLGFVNYLAKFLPHLSDVCEPLRRLTDKESVWVWQTSHEECLDKIRALVTAHPVLRYYDVNEEVTIQCDASEKGLGATLLQNGQPVAFASRALSPTEQRYAQIEKECLAIVFGCQKFDQYIHGKTLVNVESDHKPLESIFKKPLLGAPKRLQRMMLQLQKYNLKVMYKKGSEMYIADFLSRAALPQKHVTGDTPHYEIFSSQAAEDFQHEVEQTNFTEYLRVSDSRLQQIQRHTEQDEVLQSLKTTVLSGWPDKREQTPVCIRDFWGFRDEITMQNGILYKGHRVIIPKSMRPEMITRIHSSHLGIDACLRKAKDVVFWPQMGPDLIAAIQDCNTCNEFLRRQTKEPLMTHSLPTLPWSKLGMDLFSVHGQDYLIVVDYYSDFWEIDAVTDTTTRTIIECCKIHFSRHGIPNSVITDNGPQFVSSEFDQFVRKWEFEHITSSPYHSQSNGKAESAVKIAKTLIKKAKRDGKDLWKAVLDWRNTPTEGNKSSPVQRLMSRRTRTLLPTAQRLLVPKVIDGVVEQLELKRKKAKLHYDKGAKELPELTIGQSVRMQPAPSSGDGLWRKGTCVQQVAPRSYVVEADGHLYRRNRRFLRATEEGSDTDNEEPSATDRDSPAVNIPDNALLNESELGLPAEDDSAPSRCTRTRVIRTPLKYRDYIL